MIAARILLPALLLAAASPLATAATYTYNGPNFTTVSAPYTTANRVTGNFRIAGVLAANLNAADITAQLQSLSFTDGVATRTQLNSTICQFQVSTNAAGQITGHQIFLRELAPTTSSHSLETRAPGGVDLAGSVTPGVAGCGALALDPFANVATSTGLPPWTVSGVPTASIPLPATSWWSLSVLGGLLALTALGLRRR